MNFAEDYFSKKYFLEEFSSENFENRKIDCQILFFDRVFRRHHVTNDPINFIDPNGLDKLIFDNSKRTLKWFSDAGDLLLSVNARSGSIGKSGAFNLLPLESGSYAVDNLRTPRSSTAMSCPGEDGYSLDLKANFSTVRNNLRIHPDGGAPGTAGCVGISCANGDAGLFLGQVQKYLSNPNRTPLTLEVK